MKAEGLQQIAVGRQQIVDSRQQSADSKRHTVDSREQTGPPNAEWRSWRCRRTHGVGDGERNMHLCSAADAVARWFAEFPGLLRSAASTCVCVCVCVQLCV
jgi:hypothetical protein